MGGQSSMGGSSTPQQSPGIQANMGPMQGAQPMGGGFDLSKLFMGNAPASGGGMPSAPLPQIQAPARPAMPTMPVRAPMPQATPQAQTPLWYQGADGRYTQALSQEDAMKHNRRFDSRRNRNYR